MGEGMVRSEADKAAGPYQARAVKLALEAREGHEAISWGVE